MTFVMKILTDGQTAPYNVCSLGGNLIYESFRFYRNADIVPQ